MKRFKMFPVVCLFFLGFHFPLAKSNEAASAAEVERLNVVYSSIAGASISTWGPKEAGIYRKYGLDVNLIYVAGSQAIATLISGDAQIVQASGAAAILSRLAGSEVKIVGATINVIPMSLVTTPDINGPQDIKGKTFGVTRFGSLTHLGLQKALSELGLDPAKDVKMIQTGGVPENLLFMQQGIIKGALLSSPTLDKAKELGYRELLNLADIKLSSPTLDKAKELGYRELLNLADIKFRYPGTALVVTDSFIKNRPQTLNRFLKATLEGVKYAKTNQEFTIKLLGKYSRSSDTKLLASAFRTYVLGYIRDVPTITSNEVEAALEEISARNPKAKGLDPKQFYDPTPMEQLAKEGFIKQLYPR
ncbi:MAG: ABC transporter substrate-binding protein [Deltaproteobacteria bacterium]|nr:ABC transporter substrate-binding protein [Deltaproteobacteria bacterium]